MKQILENLKTGECSVEEVPAPIVKPGFLLVRNEYSLISSGTEGGTVKLGKMSLIGKARARPEQAKKVMQVAKTQGVMTAYNAAMRSLDMPLVLGYSCAGTVIEVGPGVSGFQIGDRVACGGPGFANHAEIVAVPKNLCVKVPDNLALRFASFATVGSIALQSIRVSDVRIGENVVVIGLGLIGQLTVLLLKAAGCNVFGLDIDPSRVEFVKQQGYCEGSLISAPNLAEQVNAFTDGIGADAVIITAATTDNGPIKLAGELARQKGKVICVGRTEMNAPRETYLFKELELRTSMAYGPGTADPSYELEGIDYPVAYVRWTENRNMAGFLEQLAMGNINIEPLITHEFGVEEATTAFEIISGETKEPHTAILIHYPVSAKSDTVTRDVPITAKKARDAITRQSEFPVVGVIGAGSFATNEFLPLLAKHKNITLGSIVSASGVRAKALAKNYNFQNCTSEPSSILDDDAVSCVFILTRHDTHAQLTVEALKRGKHVFVEKPLALSMDELDQVEQAWRDSGTILMVGFNRRFAPFTIELQNFIGERAQPAAILYRANVGYRPPEHWLHDPVEGGGVIIGEACHHIDFCNYIIGSPLTRVSSTALQSSQQDFLSEDNALIQLDYQDGSRASVAYLSNGSKAYPNERVEVFCDNKVAVIEDYRRMELASGLSVKRKKIWSGADRGHAKQIDVFLSAIRDSAADRIPSESYIASSKAAIEAANLIHSDHLERTHEGDN